MSDQSHASFSSLSLCVRLLWAKSGDPLGHGLLAHMLDVSAVAEVILRLEPAATLRMLAGALGLGVEDAARWLAALIGLHDLGKAIPGFLAKWPEGRAALEGAGLSFSPEIILHANQHSRATAALLPALLQRVSGVNYTWCLHVAQAVSAHHGYHFTAAEVDHGAPGRQEPAAWGWARQALMDVYWAVLAPKGLPIGEEISLPIVNWLAGFTSAADWIASNPQWFPLGERHDDLRSYHRHAMQLAEQALPQIGWHAWRALLSEAATTAELLPRIVGHPNLSPRPLQLAADALLDEVRGPALVLVEAPMGEGKTELAFLAYLRLQAANQHRGLYVALPTQATGNALFIRTERFLRAFASGSMDLQLVHGGAAMNDELARMRGLGELQGVGDVPADTLTANAWFGQRSRPLLSPNGVGTIDQALYAALNVKHHFVRLWGLGNRVVVLDEVHAYDTYTSGLIDTLLRWLKALNCSVVLMSATLPRERRGELLHAWGAADASPQTYPRLVLADANGTRTAKVQARTLPSIELRGLGSSVEALAHTALDQLAHGGCGAVIVNTVSRAQALYRRMQKQLAEQGRCDTQLLLFHARFPADRRQQLEQRVQSMFGNGDDAMRPASALLVATQVAEQSLDIDFDFMISDLAPVDLLLQRAGRLHRHKRDLRPMAHAQARLWVAGLLSGSLPDMKGTAWGFVYDPYILARTWALLVRESVLTFPDDIDRLVQAVYDKDHDLAEDLDDQVRKFIEVSSYGEYRAKVKNLRQLAVNIAIDPRAEALAVYDGKPRGHEEDESGLGLTNTTRQGEESITLVPVELGDDGLWHIVPGDVGVDPTRLLSAETARALYVRQLRVSHRWVVRRVQGQPQPPAFADHALLRHMWPLFLRDGRSVDPGLRLTLSDEMGLMFEDVADGQKTQEGDE